MFNVESECEKLKSRCLMLQNYFFNQMKLRVQILISLKMKS